MRSAKMWFGVSVALNVFILVGVLWLGYLALVTNQTLCDFKRDLQGRRDASAMFLQSIESGARQLPEGFTIQDLRSSLAARDATLRSLSDLQCSP